MNMKKIFAGIMTVCIVGGFMPFVDVTADNVVITASAVDDYTVGTYELLKYKNYGDYIEISGCDQTVTEVVIPSEIEGLPVTAIGAISFEECEFLTSVTIPDSVKSIGRCAFLGCTALTSITIPESVKSIGRCAFWGCTALTSITIPKSVKDIEGSAFIETSWLEERRKENPLVVVNDIVIDGSTCSGDVIIPQGVTGICESAFSYCNTVTSIKIPDSVKSIGIYAFDYCSNLTSIEVPDSVTVIEEGTFRKCSGLTSVTLSDSITSIGDFSFIYCGSLKSITIPESVVSIGNKIFEGCSDLMSVTILNSECEIYDNIDTISNGLTENYDYYFDGTIYGYENSTAQAYAEKYDRKFELLGETPAEELAMGDIDGDGIINSSDASFILAEYSKISTSGAGDFTEDMKNAADINKDGLIDSVDSSLILSYYSYTSTGGTDTIEKYLESKK